MLNKLLKRCMPWMDKGRWYHVGITTTLNPDEGLGITDVAFDESMFSQYEYNSNDNTLKLFFSDPGIRASIIDYKTAVNGDIPGQLMSYVSIPSDHAIEVGREESGFNISIHPMPGVMDLWLFIKSN